MQNYLRPILSSTAAILLTSCLVEMPAESTAPAETTPGEVPFELTAGGSAIIIPVGIERQGPYRFILDTGATLTCLDAALAKKLDLAQRRGVIGRGIGVGSQERVGMVSMDSVEVGSATAKDLTACTLDLQTLRGAGLEVDGLLGLNFLRQYRMTLDFERQTLKLESP